MDAFSKKQQMAKKLDEDFVETVNTMAEAQITKEMIKLLNEIDKIDTQKAADETLKDLKEKVTDLNAGYKDARKAFSVKVSYLLETLRERGHV